MPTRSRRQEPSSQAFIIPLIDESLFPVRAGCPGPAAGRDGVGLVSHALCHPRERGDGTRLVGFTPAEAERAAAGQGLSIAIERQYYSADVPEGRIISQIPAPGMKVRRGWQVRAAQSLGPQRVAIPDIVGQSARAADLNIRRRGLDVGSLAYLQMPGVAGDQVLAQSPPPNASSVTVPRISLLVTADLAAGNVRDAELCWPTAGHCESRTAGCWVSRGQRDSGSCPQHAQYYGSKCTNSAPASALACQHHRFANACARATGEFRSHCEFRSALEGRQAHSEFAQFFLHEGLQLRRSNMAAKKPSQACCPGTVRRNEPWTTAPTSAPIH